MSQTMIRVIGIGPCGGTIGRHHGHGGGDDGGAHGRDDGAHGRGDRILCWW